MPSVSTARGKRRWADPEPKTWAAKWARPTTTGAGGEHQKKHVSLRKKGAGRVVAGDLSTALLRFDQREPRTY